jgi:hypothetical protein
MPDLFAPAVVDPAVNFLHGLAGTGSALELGIGTGRIALPPTTTVSESAGSGVRSPRAHGTTVDQVASLSQSGSSKAHPVRSTWAARMSAYSGHARRIGSLAIGNPTDACRQKICGLRPAGSAVRVSESHDHSRSGSVPGGWGSTRGFRSPRHAWSDGPSAHLILRDELRDNGYRPPRTPADVDGLNRQVSTESAMIPNRLIWNKSGIFICRNALDADLRAVSSMAHAWLGVSTAELVCSS